MPTKAVPIAADLLPIVDSTVIDNKKVTIGSLPVSTATQTALNAKVTANGAITGATKTKITYDSKGLVTAGADATTADIGDSLNKRYVTDAQLTVISNTSGTNTGDQDLSTLALKATTISTTAPLTGGGDLSANRTLSIPAATTLVDGYLTSTDWTTFNNKEPSISAGTTAQYWRGDKSFQTLDKTSVGLGNVDNTSDINKPISTATQNALDLKVNLTEMQKTQLAYVSPSGSNTTGDGSFARPYLTIAHTIANTLDGATIFLLPGLYTEATIAIPANTGSRAFRGFSANATELQNGITHTAGAVNAGFSFDSININSATLNEAAAINGFIYFTKCWFSLTRTDSNASVVFTSTESNISSGALSGGSTNIFNEALVIGAITCSGGFSIFENCKFVTTLEAQGTALVRMLDCELFGAAFFVNGTIVSTNTPSWEVDLSTDYLGGYTGAVNKTKLASITSSMVSDIAIQASGLMNVPFYSKLSTLTDATNIATNVSQGNIFSVTLTGDRNLSAPTGMTSSRQRATWIITQDGTGGRTLTFDVVFNFGIDLTGVSISNSPNATSYIGAMYNPTTSKWDVISILRGY